MRAAQGQAPTQAVADLPHEEFTLTKSVIRKRKRSPQSRPPKATGTASTSAPPQQPAADPQVAHASGTPVISAGFETAGYASEFALTQRQALIDARLEAQIWTTYALTAYLRANTIEIAVQGGKAVLQGQVEDGLSSELAEQIALRVAGITVVDNQLTIAQCELPLDRSAAHCFGEVVEDATVAAMVRAKIAWSRHAAGLSTKVETRRGRVTLSGTAACATSKAFAGRLALFTCGVKAVNNQLAVKAAQARKRDAAGGRVSKETDDMADGWITARIKSTFRYSSKVDDADISVSTKAGVVTLRGRMERRAARALAVELASNVRGVKQVDSHALVL